MISCDLIGEATVHDEEGNSATLSEVGLYSGITTTDFRCFTDEIDMPEYIISMMSETRALDGRQSEEWGNYKVSWNYHPDDGMNATFTFNDN